MIVTPQKVIRLVQERLTPYQPKDDSLRVLPKAVHQEGRWWYVVVPSSQSIVNASDYNRRVRKAERDLEKLDDLRVTILPVAPGWMDPYLSPASSFDAQKFAARLAVRQGRWPLLEGWSEAWCHSFGKEDGYHAVQLDRAEERLSLPLPTALRQLYRFAGHRLSKYNDPLIEPEGLEVAQNQLPFWAENQYVMTWGVKTEDLTSDDPPVHLDLSGCDSYSSNYNAVPNELIQQNETLSEFVFQMIVWDYVKWAAGSHETQGEQEVMHLLGDCQPLGFPEWTQEAFQRGQGAVRITTRFYGDD